MGMMASQITSLTNVYSAVYSDADRRKHQSSASLAFVRGIHRWPVNSLHKGPVMRKMFPFDDVLMFYEWKLTCVWVLITTICPAIFHGSSSYLVQLLTSVGAVNLVIMGSLCSFYWVSDLLLALGGLRVPIPLDGILNSFCWSNNILFKMKRFHKKLWHFSWGCNKHWELTLHIDGLLQERRNSSVLAM